MTKTELARKLRDAAEQHFLDTLNQDLAARRDAMNELKQAEKTYGEAVALAARQGE